VASVIGVFLAVGGWLERRIRDSMRPLWYSFPATCPRGQSLVPDTSAEGLNQWVERLRTHRMYERFTRFWSRYAFPGLFLLGTMYLAVALVSRAGFNIASSNGKVCKKDEQKQKSNDKGKKESDEKKTKWNVSFKTNAVCTFTGVPLKKGATYRLLLWVPISDQWVDNGVRASPQGVHPDNVTTKMTLAVPLRRTLTQPWFKPIARIGDIGTDEYPLEPDPSIAWDAKDTEGKVFQTKIVARSTGPLFLYVNDAVLFPPWTAFYRDNDGSAEGMVEEVLPVGTVQPGTDAQ
jgi:hypothetical protein